ncbi:histone-lysine N-methyltransferase NSD2 [Tribolium castaneum]|uniref:Uncharacterized protein n=1 Tax=Tribolium castaneum TaxID=7070 RepID=D6WZP0_TRICA|nr:PREDICTED: histone-lysine N-methyltransferase NSD2 [Tribolium castaneum]EFA10454.1 hypothetical protein TcasGA2_TC012700 [Tribolium castaneum]|eukprot:XP_008198269.1 PREDICTED: histone-lysine N-methyltransferase NSD2 [Tribolium castaneum]
MASPQACLSSSPEIVSPGGKSRYGRTRRPKISHDFCNIDDVIIDDNPPEVKSPLKARDVVFEIKDEFTKLDDLGMKVANNFKTNRGLDASIKERKFFKSAVVSKAVDVVDVSKVLKLVSTPGAEAQAKSPPKTVLKTYSNRRKHAENERVVESFGLPDEPIIPVKGHAFQRHSKIDVDFAAENDVSLPNPWTFDEIFTNEMKGPTNGETFDENTDFQQTLTPKGAKNAFERTTGKKRLFRSSAEEGGTIVTVSPVLKKAKVGSSPPKRVLRSNFESNVKIQSSVSPQNETNDSVVEAELPSAGNESEEELPNISHKSLRSSTLKNKSPEKRIEISHEKNKIKTKSPEKCKPKKGLNLVKTAKEISTETNKIRVGGTECTVKNKSPKKSKTKEALNPVVTVEEISPEKNNVQDDAAEENPLKNGSSGKSKTKEALNPVKMVKTSAEKNDGLEAVTKSALTMTQTKTKEVFNPVVIVTEISPEKNNVQEDVAENRTEESGPKNKPKEVFLNPVIIMKEFSAVKNDGPEAAESEPSMTQSKTKEVLEISAETNQVPENETKEELKVIKQEVIELEVGVLAWAKLGNFPYWPCLITQEPASGTHQKYVVNRIHPLYHVRFFGDKGRRSWVHGPNVMPFYAKDDLERLAKTLEVEGKFKPSYINECCFIRRTLMKKWQEGVAEAESLQFKTVDERLNYFSKMFARKNELKQERQKLKRARLSAAENLSKKVKIEEIETLELIKPEPVEVTSSPDTLIKPPKKKNFLKKEEFSDEQLEARKKLRNPQVREEIPQPSSAPKLRKKPQGENSNSDTDSKFSDNSSLPPSMQSQAALFRRNNIFRGIPREKVCQICEKSGEIFKCKGPCNGVYHPECAMNRVVEQKSSVEIISLESKQPLPDLGTSPNYTGMSLAEKIDHRMKEIMKKFDQSVYCESTDSSSDEYVVEEVVRQASPPAQSKLSLTVTATPTKKEVPIIKHVTADNISYICVSNEAPKEDTTGLKCTWCASDEAPLCLVCGEMGAQGRQKCSLHQCGRFYHPECLKLWPQTQWSLNASDSFVCPRHVCHTCISDDPRAANSRCSSDKIVKCLKCPATYHSSNYCVPAGTEILTASQIICPRHFTRNKRNYQSTINANWCFICSNGGDLICCETCPTSVHRECLPGDLGEVETFFCEDCQSGRLPLYDEIVWVKLGSFRWWPAVILFPNEVPDNVKNIPHSKGEFVVKFYGTYDHYWVGRGRTFLFQEGDRGHSGSVKKRVDNAFVKAIEEAAAAHELKKQFKARKFEEKNSGMKPPPYVRIKVNKPVGNVRVFDGNTSNTTSCDCDPNQPHPCGPDSDCLNRLLLTECNPDVCPAGDRCNNQCFEKREYPPLVPHRTLYRGWGLKTLAPIRKGQFVIEYVGEMIDEQEYQRRVQKMHEQKEENYYFLTIDKDRMLDAGPKGNVARFMNHSCDPNCETQKWTVNGDTRVGLFANCDIPAGTELTFNYNLECIGKEKKICHCGAPNCSGFIGVKVKTDNPPKKSTKAKKKKTPPLEYVDNDNPCFICGKQGDVAACNNKICTKYYHLACVGLEAWPEGNKWVCQWHNCNICTKRTIRCCVRCINSYCPSHSDGNVRYDKLLGFVCSEHDSSKESNAVVTSHVPAPDSCVSDEGVVTSTTSDDSRMNGFVTSTPVKKNDNSYDESVVSSSEKKPKKVKKKKVENTANFLLENEVKLNNFAPVKYLRTSRSRNSDPERDLPIRKRTRLRCGSSL